MASTVIIGKVAVKVYPDTSDFREELRRELEREEAGTGVEVPVDLDATSIRKELAQLRAEIKRVTTAKPIKVDIELDKTAVPQAQAIKDQIQATLEEVDTAVNVETGESTKGLDELERKARVTRKSLEALNRPQLFDRLSRQVQFDPQTKLQFKNRIDTMNRMLAAEERLNRQREREMAANAKAVVKSVRDEANALEQLHKTRKSIQASTRKQLEEARSAAQARIKLEETITKQNEAQAKLLEDQAKKARDHELAMEKVSQAVSRINNNDAFNEMLGRTTGLLAEVEDGIRDLGKYETARLEVEVKGVPAAKRQIAQLRARMDELSASITPEMDEHQKRRILHQVARLREQIQNEMKPVPVNILPQFGAVGRVARRSVSISLAFLARPRFAEYIPHINNPAFVKVGTMLAALSGARLSRNITRDLLKFVGNIDKALPKVAALSTSLLGLAGWALSASSNLFALSSSLASIVPAALALPGIFAGIGIGAAITFVAFADMKNRFKGLKKGWEDLGKTIKDNFWARAIEPMRQMSRVLMPEITQGFKNASAEAGNFFGRFSNSLTKELKGKLKPMFDDLSKSMRVMSGYTDSIARSIAILGGQGAGRLPQLAAWFGEINETFANFLTRAEKDGSLTRWVDTGIQAMKDLGGVVYETGRLLGGLGRAAEAAGGTTLGDLRAKLKGIADIVNSPEFQTRLIGVLKAAHKAMDNISNTAGPAVTNMFKVLSSTLEKILPQVGATIGMALGAIADAIAQPSVQRGIVAFFQGINQAVAILAPVMKPLATAMGVFFLILGKAMVDVAPILATVLTTLVDVFLELAPSIMDVASLLSDAFLNVLVALAPVLVDLAKRMAPVIVMFAQGLNKTLAILTPVLAVFATAIGGLIINAIIKLTPVIVKLVQTALPIFVKLMYALIDVVIQLLPYLAPLVATLGTALLDAIKLIIPMLPGLVEAFLSIVDAVIKLVPQIVALLPQIVALVPELLRMVPAFLQLVPLVIDLVEALLPFVPTLVQMTLDLLPAFIRCMEDLIPSISKVVGWVEKLYGKFKEAEKWTGSLIDGFELGMDKGLPAADAAVSRFGRGIINTFKKIFGIHSPSTVFAGFGGFIVAGLINGIQGTSLSGLFNGISERLTGYFTHAGTWLKTAGGNLITGFVNGIIDSFDLVKRTLTTLTSYLPEWKGPPRRDSTLLVNAGQLIMQGLADGLRDGFGDVEKLLGETTNTIAKTEFKAPGLKSGAVTSKLSTTIGASLGGSAAAGGDINLTVVAPDGTAPELVGEAMFNLRDLRRGGVG